MQNNGRHGDIADLQPGLQKEWLGCKKLRLQKMLVFNFKQKFFLKKYYFNLFGRYNKKNLKV